MTAPSKHPTEKGLGTRYGKWEYRFKLNGKLYSRVTDLEAVADNVLEAQAQKAVHLEELRKGKRVVRQIGVALDQAVPRFVAWYRSEHQNRKCGWAVSLMVSFQFYFEEKHILLARIGPAELEDFKMWRRDNNIHDNTLRKQLLLLGQFFRCARKQGWIKNDPFAKGDDDAVKIPSEQDSGIMRVLSPSEEKAYFAAARTVSVDLADVAAIMISQGPRPDEVMSLQQNHVDLFQRRFTIWDTSADGKSRNAHRTLKMTDRTFSVFARRLSTPGVWVFPSPKNQGPRTTLQKSQEQAARGSKNEEGSYEGAAALPVAYTICGTASRPALPSRADRSRY
jgi:integrase